MNWVKQSKGKDPSIHEKADKQKPYEVKVTYGDVVKETMIWAVNKQEAEDKIHFKHLEADKTEVKGDI